MTFKYPKIKILCDLLDTIKRNIFLIIMVFIININSDSTYIHILRYVIIALIITGFLSRLKEVLFTKVVFSADGVRVYTGMFSKAERFIPREKFENVQTASTVLQRFFGAQTVTMETGDADGDVTLKFVKQAEREMMEAYVLSDHEPSKVLQDEDTGVLFSPTVQDLLKASLTSFSFLAIIPIVFNVWSDLRLEKWIDVEGVKISLWVTMILILLAIALAIGIGVLKTFNSYYQYKISMDDERIYIQKGWFSKQSLSIRKEKVQAVIYKQNWYQKLLRVTTIRLISTGEIMKSDDQQINEFFPYLPTAKADELIATMLPQFSRHQSMTHRASRKARKLIWLRPPIFAAILLLLGFWKTVFLIIGVAVFVLTYISRMLAYKNLAFALQEQHVQVQTGGFIVETLVTKRSKLIELAFERSILQRATGVMAMKLTNRAKPIRVTEVNDIDATLQKELTEWFEQRTKEVQIDPNTKDGALKKDSMIRLVTVLKTKAQQLENQENE